MQDVVWPSRPGALPAACHKAATQTPCKNPYFLYVFRAGCGGLPDLVHCLLSANEEQAAYLTGVLWELAAEPEMSNAVVACHSVALLLHVISKSISLVPCECQKPQTWSARSQDSTKSS